MSQRGKEVRCVYWWVIFARVWNDVEQFDSRTPWQGDTESLARIKSLGKMNDEGYVNVGAELGLSGARGMISSPAHHLPHIELTARILILCRLFILSSAMGEAAIWQGLLVMRLRLMNERGRDLLGALSEVRDGCFVGIPGLLRLALLAKMVWIDEE